MELRLCLPPANAKWFRCSPPTNQSEVLAKFSMDLTHNEVFNGSHTECSFYFSLDVMKLLFFFSTHDLLRQFFTHQIWMTCCDLFDGTWLWHWPFPIVYLSKIENITCPWSLNSVNNKHSIEISTRSFSTGKSPINSQLFKTCKNE